MRSRICNHWAAMMLTWRWNKTFKIGSCEAVSWTVSVVGGFKHHQNLLLSHTQISAWEQYLKECTSFLSLLGDSPVRRQWRPPAVPASIVSSCLCCDGNSSRGETRPGSGRSASLCRIKTQISECLCFVVAMLPVHARHRWWAVKACILPRRPWIGDQTSWLQFFLGFTQSF